MRGTIVRQSPTEVPRRPSGRTFVRPDWNDHRLIRGLALQGIAVGVIVPSTYLVSLALPDSAELFPDDNLAAHAENAAMPWMRDPATPGLAHPQVVNPLFARRLRQIPEALGVALPFDTHRLSDNGVANELADRSQTAQLGSAWRAAPYFEIASRLDPTIEWNVRLVSAVANGSPSQPVVAFIQVPRGKVRRGLLRQLVRAYQDSGAQIVVIRVRGLTAKKADGADLEALLQASRAFRNSGIEVLYDCAGRLGAVLAAASDGAFSTGGSHFRGINGWLLSRPGGGGGAPVTLELSGGLREVPPDHPQAMQMLASDALGTTLAPSDLKLRRIAEYDGLSGLNLNVLIKRLRLEGPQLNGWADVLLQERRRRTA